MDYKKLFQDKENGKVDEKMVIVFDNDGGYWACETESEEESDKMCAEYTKLYGEPEGYVDVVNIMLGAGFKSEWC